MEDVKAAEETAKNAKLRKVELTVARVEPLKKALDRETELAAAHTEYEQTQSRLSELEALAPDYEVKKAEVTRWKDEMQRLESDYLQTRTPLVGQIDTLKKKVELLNNSGCPDIEKATCKFLADAQEAKEKLPAVETTLANLEEEYGNGRRRVTEAFYAAKEALEGSLYQPEAIDGLRAAVRRLEGAEKEYRNLAAQRNELALVNERLDELEKRVEEGEAAAEKGRAELVTIDQQISEVAGANEEYGKLQAEIAVARQWVDREKQLPVAREQKNIAAQRLLELTTEIEAIEKEISERRDELAAEQGKMAGTEELRAQVNAAEAEINGLRDTAQAVSVKLGGLRELVEQVEKKLAEATELQRQMNDLSGKAAGYEELKRAFSQDGIPHNIIRSIIPVFEATATNILGQMSQGRMSVEFVTEKVLKSNSKKEVTTLDIIINDSGTGRLPYMSRSGGERVKAALSVILALSEIKSSKAGVRLGFLFIDEAPFLDTEGTQAYCDALEAIQRRYPNTKVMAITHDETFKARFPQSVTVYKDENGSHVRGD